MNYLYKVLLIIILSLSSIISFSQCVVSSTSGYNVNVYARPIEIIKIDNGGGCTYRVRIEYNIYFTGVNIPPNMLYTLQANLINSTYPQNNFFDLPNIGGSGINITATGSITGSNCDDFNLSDICTTYELIIQGPDLSYRTVSCNWVPIGSPLPIELLEFKGQEKDGVNVISWITSSERNNDYFTLERSRDAINWKVIDYIKGSGNSTTELNYEYLDNNYDSDVYNYYRLKQTDFNGESEIFETIAIYNKSKKIIKILNIMGESVNINTKGLIFIIYEDEIIKQYNF